MALPWKAVGVLLAALICLGVGAASGGWLASRHYRPLLDTANEQLATEKSVNGNLLALTTEQGLALGKLVKAGEDRAQAAKVAVDDAKNKSQPDYAAANRIQQERTGGDPATAAMSIIDQELGL
ncbi:hypothetical protein [Pseudomonas syringae]|uniref:hypothetical protein n=1 Tax=Pseudomonas syringae TaxID=317 RepID=UPI001F0F9160|nr:hypothetical protein [Pseudomonas syringae]MCH5583097.1 hypothetical protein [Pseudomonas syringae pv. syringae]MDF5791055.1 hypothetical protein [Pseudomonas syringae pv. syringae]